jgi:putative thiazole-containing bacteriocin maturation protein
VKPKLKNDTLYLPSAEGVYIISNGGTLTLKGKQIYGWIDRIAPYLDGRRTLTEITSKLSENRRDIVVDLVRTLHKKGFVKDVAGDLAHGLDPEEQAAYVSEISFVDYYVDSAAHRFERFRNSRVLSVGSGLTFTALVQANLHSGLKRVLLATTAECATNGARHEEFLALAQRRDPKQALEEVAVFDANACIDANALGALTAVIHVADRSMLARARQLNRACVKQGKLLMQAVVRGDHAWLGPLVGPEHGDACWECAWLRLLGHEASKAEGDVFVDRPDTSVSEFLAGPTAAIIANQLSFEIFKCITGGGPL